MPNLHRAFKPALLAIILLASVTLPTPSATTHAMENQVLALEQASVSLEKLQYLSSDRDSSTQEITPELLSKQDWQPLVSRKKGITRLRKAHWFKLDMLNPETTPQIRILWHSTANTHEVDVYLQQGQKQLGTYLLGASRINDSPAKNLLRNAIELQIPSGESQLYIKLYQQDLLIHGNEGLHLDSKTRFLQQDADLQRIPFITLPIFLVMALYNLGLLLTTGYKPYLWVALIALANIFISLSWAGSGFYYFWPNNIELNHVITNLSLATSGACIAGFTLSYLQLKTRNKYLYSYCLILGVSGFIYRAFHNLIIYPVTGLAFPQYLDLVLNLISPTLVICALYMSLRYSDLPSLHYTIAWTPYCFSVLSQVFYPTFSDELWLLALAMDGGLVLSLVLMSLISGKKIQHGNENVIREKDQFLARISHEMRTPLNGIMGSIDLLKAGQKPDPELLQNLSLSAQYLDDAVYNILDFSEIHHQQAQLELSNKKFNNFVIKLSQEHYRDARQKNIEFCIAYSPLIPEVLSFDYKRLRTVLNKLLDNSIKFTEMGFVTCAITVHQHLGQHCLLRFSIRDTGIGISEEQQAYIFDAFSQSGEFFTREYGGMGLGLALAAQNLQLMGSQIKLNSQPEKGSHFHFDIRTYVSLHSNREEAKRTTIERNFNGLKVLYVEDNKVNQMVTEKMLKKRGFIVDLAENGEIGVNKVNHHQYDLILMDCSMPVMNGFDATKQIRANGFVHLPIVAVTANAMEGDRQRCLDAGMNEYVAKPVKSEILFKIISLSLHT